MSWRTSPLRKLGELECGLWTTRITDLDVHFVIPLGLAPGSRTIPHLGRSDKQLAIRAADRQFDRAVIGCAAQDEMRILVRQLRCGNGRDQECQGRHEHVSDLGYLVQVAGCRLKMYPDLVVVILGCNRNVKRLREQVEGDFP